MCGLAGFLSLNHEYNSSHLLNMANSIHHRGPDGQGHWIDTKSGIGLVHTRLAIVDLSPAGHQPMLSADARYVITFNGEIYNHLELRNELESDAHTVAWRGHSDTETLLAGFDKWGILDTIKKAVGMFAIAVWDNVECTLTLVRDRLGEKPLYYGWQNETFLFGSELKALKAHPCFLAEINRDAISTYLRYGYVPAPYSIYKGVQKLMPGTLAVISLKNPTPKIVTYWSMEQVLNENHNTFIGSTHDAINSLEKQLKESIKLQMMADVPLGAFLSGGVDSSTIVALMQSESERPIKTFSIGFHDQQYNEAHYAKAVADHLRTEHTELYVTADDALAIIPHLAEIYDEPFADASQIPTYLVAKMARQHVTVALSGDAGDELFSGYNRYLMTHKIWRVLSRLPLWSRKLVSQFVTSISPKAWNFSARVVRTMLPAKYRAASVPFSDKLYKSANVICAENISDLYQKLVSVIQKPEKYVLNSNELKSPFLQTGSQPKTFNDIEQMMAIDMIGYLPNDILTKVDRAAMAVSLETRVPLLDHRIIELAWKLPIHYKLHDGVGKWILREVLYKYVPRKLIERPKMGFGTPIDVWLRGPLSAWAEELLSVTRLSNEGFFDVNEVRQLWSEHLSGRRNYQYQLWNILMFQLWLDKNYNRTD